MDPSLPPKTNILCLDGGGVRGYSSLLILRKLLCLVRNRIKQRINHAALPSPGRVDGETSEVKPMLPGDIFDIVVGTSTGGLIALMIVKLGMPVDECISAYEQLSKKIFSKRHFVGTFTHGLSKVSKYCGKHYKKVIVENVIIPNLPKGTMHPEHYQMTEDSMHHGISCTLVCTELDPETLDREMGHAVHICTHTCNRSLGRITVATAARATSAAPTFFSPVKVAGRVLADGGYGTYNNPSWTAWEHWDPYWNRDKGSVQFVNIGTGTTPRRAYRKRGIIERLPILQELLRTKRDLVRIANDSEETANNMRSLQKYDPQKLSFDRFSADTAGLSFIALDAHEKLDRIRDLTEEYLGKVAVIKQLDEVAERLTDTYIRRRRASTAAAQAIIQAV